MRKMLALSVLCFAAVPALADTKLSELPAGSIIRFKGNNTVPAGWSSVYWGGVGGFTFLAPLQQSLVLTGEVRTTGVGTFGEKPAPTNLGTDESRGRVGVYLQSFGYRVPLDSKHLKAFEFDDVREFNCRTDADGNPVNETVARGEVTVELLNACFANLFEIIPNDAVLYP